MENESMYLLALQQGFGFTEACSMSGNDPKQITDELTGDDGLRLNTEKAMRSYKVEQLRMLKDLVQKNRFTESQQASANVMNAPQLAMWGVALVSKDKKVRVDLQVTPQLVVTTFMQYKRPKDVATALGMQYTDYVQYVSNNPVIADVLAKFGTYQLA